MMQLKIFKNSFIRTLASNIQDNIESYRSGDFSWTLDLENGENYFVIDAPWFDESILATLNGISAGIVDEVDDARDSKILYSAMRNMPPSLARDSRFWTTLCHTHGVSYIRDRNHKFINDPELTVSSKYVKSRFFIENTRSYERTNALARLWWFGYIAESTGLDFDTATDVLLSYTDFRAATVERPDVFVHREIRAAVIDLAIAKKSTGDDFYKDRHRYRPLFKDITERATRVFFPTMDHQKALSFVTKQLDIIDSKLKATKT